MPAFSISPAQGFARPDDEGFPNYIQFQAAGSNLGLPNADTLNFGSGLTATRGTGENANVVTVTAEGGGGGAQSSAIFRLSGGMATPNVVVEWDAPQEIVSLDGVSMTATAITVTPGVYAVTMQVQLSLDQALPSNQLFYMGSSINQAGYSEYAIPNDQYPAFSDTFFAVVTEGSASLDFVVYFVNESGETQVLIDASMMVEVRRISSS